MRIIEIETLDNGAHRNQSYHGVLPEGWAFVPDDLETENFPFGEIAVEEVNGVMTVTEWVATDMPIVEERPQEPAEPTTTEILDTLLGVTSDE